MRNTKETDACARGTCFANKNGWCAVLSDTDFPDNDCPFYKTKRQLDEGRGNASRRLRLMGRRDLIERYGSSDDIRLER